MNRDLEALLRGGLDKRSSEAPPAPALAHVLDQCKLDLRRHRRRVAAITLGSVAAAVAVGVAAPALVSGSDLSSEDRVVDGARLSESGVLEACRNGTQPQYWTDLVFGAGSPRIAAHSRVTEQSSTVLVSADGRYWADCMNAEGALPGGAVTMTVYASAASTPPAYSAGLRCEDGRSSDCDRFIVDYVDRLSAEVRAVEFETADGATSVVRPDDEGFVLFDYEGVAPDEYLQAGEGTAPWITRISYLNADGVRLASQRFGKSGPEAVPGTPPLTDYPSLARIVMETETAGDTPSKAPTGDAAVRVCSGLLREGWTPPQGQHPELGWDPTTGVMNINFTDESIVVNAYDPDCVNLPGVVGDVIGRAVRDVEK